MEEFIFAIGAFVLLSVVLLTLVKIVWDRLMRFALQTEVSWDDRLLQALHLPVRLLVLIIAAGTALQAVPESYRHHPVALHGPKILLILTGLWILDRFYSLAIANSAGLAKLSAGTRSFFHVIARVLSFSIAIMIILDTLGISITPILASLGVGSLAVALALQDTLSNFFSGLYLLIDKPIRVGDYVKLDENIEGFVRKIGWRSTQIHHLSNNMILIPNSKLSASTLTNFDLPERETAVGVVVGVDYISDLEKVEQVTLDVARDVQNKTLGGVKAFEPSVRFHTFGDMSVKFSVGLRAAQYTDGFLIKHEFIKALHARYKQEGITISSPHRPFVPPGDKVV